MLELRESSKSCCARESNFCGSLYSVFFVLWCLPACNRWIVNKRFNLLCFNCQVFISFLFSINSPHCRFVTREKSKLEEFTNDFAKELLEYRKMQKERRRSYSRFVFCNHSFFSQPWSWCISVLGFFFNILYLSTCELTGYMHNRAWDSQEQVWRGNSEVSFLSRVKVS